MNENKEIKSTLTQQEKDTIYIECFGSEALKLLKEVNNWDVNFILELCNDLPYNMELADDLSNMIESIHGEHNIDTFTLAIKLTNRFEEEHKDRGESLEKFL